MVYERRNWDKSVRPCKQCGNDFTPRIPKQVFCGEDCRARWYEDAYKIRKWDKSPRICAYCGKEFIPISVNQKYCNVLCTRTCNVEKYQKKDWNESPRKCKWCGKTFSPTTAKQRYCNISCRHLNYKATLKVKRRKQTRKPVDQTPVYINFGSLRFWKESEFEEWFMNNFAIFGIKQVRKLRHKYPDLLAETYDGKMLRIELELSSLNFIDHKHDPAGCDLIISFVKPYRRTDIKGVPNISIFNARGLNRGMATYDSGSLELTDYFKTLVKFMNEHLLAFLAKHPKFNTRKIPSFLDYYKDKGDVGEFKSQVQRSAL